MTCVNEYCRGSRAHRFTRKQLHSIKHLPCVRAIWHRFRPPMAWFALLWPAGWRCSPAFSGGWWRDSLHRRVVSMKGWVHVLKGKVWRVVWKKTVGKVLAAKAMQRGPVKKLTVEIQDQRYMSPFLVNVLAHLSVCIFVPHSAVQYLKTFQQLREKKLIWVMYLFSHLHHRN